MKRTHRVGLLVAAVASVLGAPLQAQPNSGALVYTAEAGATRAGGRIGLGVAVGLARRWDHMMLGAAVELIVAPTGNNNRASEEDLVSTERQCNARQTGLGSEDLLCRGVDVTPGFIANVDFAPLRAIPVTVGAGFRFGETYGPVATLGFFGPVRKSGAQFRGTVMGGDRYLSLRFGVVAPIPGRWN